MQICVIIPTYNRKKLIKECLESFFLLTHRPQIGVDLKIIVVDDGSTDQTVQFLENQFQEMIKTNRLIVLPKENAERGAARNFGAQWCFDNLNPDAFLFFDSDDKINVSEFQNAIAELAQKFEISLKGTEWAYSYRFQVWDGENKYTHVLPVQPTRGDRPTEKFIQLSCLPLGTTFVSASAYKKINGFSEIRKLSGSEDWIFFYELSLFAKIHYGKIIICSYRQHISNTPSHYYDESIPLSKKMIAEILQKYDLSQAERQRLESMTSRKYDYMYVAALNKDKDIFGKKYAKFLNLLGDYPLEIFKFRFHRLLFSLLKQDIKVLITRIASSIHSN